LGIAQAAIQLKTNLIHHEWRDLPEPGGNPRHFPIRNLRIKPAFMLYVTEITVKQCKMTVA